MMTDREMLEMAAKASGYDGLGMWDEKLGYLCDFEGWSFDPMNENGDAFWLAMRLNMSIEISEHEDSTYAYAGAVPRVYGYEMWKGEKESATRRAIVSAAAQVGALMP